MRISSILLCVALVACPSVALADVSLPACPEHPKLCGKDADCPGSTCTVACQTSDGTVVATCADGAATGGASGASGNAGAAGASSGTAGSSGAAGSLSPAGASGTSSTPASSDSDDGCSVRAPGRHGALAMVMLAAGAVSLLLQRRRR